MASSSESKYQINPAITSEIMKTKNINYGHAISKMFDSLGDIEVKDEDREQKAADRALTQESLKLNIDNAKKDQILKGISVQGIQDKLEDEKVVGSYIASDYTDYNTYAKDKGVKLRSPEMMQAVEKLSDANYSKLMDENLALHEGYLKETGKHLDEKGNVNMSAVREQLKLDPLNNIGLAQAFERKYGMKLEKPAETLGAKDQASILKSQSDIKKNEALTEKYKYEMKNGGDYAPTSTKKEYNDEMTSKYGNDKTTWEPYHEWATVYRDGKKLTGEATYNRIVNQEIDKFSGILNTTDFARVDFDKAITDKKMTPNDKYQLERSLASTREAKVLESQYGKYKMEFKTIEGQADRFAQYAKSEKVNTHVVQNAVDIVKSYIPNLELDEKELENFKFRSDFLNLSSTILRLQSGLTVSDKERVNFEQSMGTLSKNKEVNFVGIYQKILDKKNALEGVKETAPEYFNIKYGKTLSNLEEALKVIGGIGVQTDPAAPNINKTVTRIIGEQPQETTKIKVITPDQAQSFGIKFN